MLGLTGDLDQPPLIPGHSRLKEQKLPSHWPTDLLFHWEVQKLQVGNAEHMPRKD